MFPPLLPWGLRFLKLETRYLTHSVSNSHSRNKSTDMLKIPFDYTSKKDHQIQFDWMKEETVPVIFEIIQRVGRDSSGMNPNDFYPEEKLKSILLPAISKQQAIQITDMSLDKIIGMYYIQPSPLCRSASPLLNSGYGIMDHGYHDSGIGRIGAFLYCVIAKQSGFIGVNARAGIWNPLSYSAQLSHGAVLTAYVPHSCNTPKQGWSHDFIIHHMYSSIGNTISEDEAIDRAFKPTKLISSEPHTYIQCDETFPLINGSKSRIRSTKENCDIEKAFDILSQAAYNGDGFAIDEFPSLEIFQKTFLHGRQLILIDIDNKLNVGVGILGESHLCRSAGTPNAVIYFYLLPHVRGQGYGETLFLKLEEHAVRCGFTAILVDLFITRNISYLSKFLRHLNYTNTGNIPLSGYVKGQGLTDTLVFYKKFGNENLFSILGL